MQGNQGSEGHFGQRAQREGPAEQGPHYCRVCFMWLDIFPFPGNKDNRQEIGAPKQLLSRPHDCHGGFPNAVEVPIAKAA